MANLILKDFQAKTQSEFWGDSPYFMIYIAHAGAPKYSYLKVIRKEEWDSGVPTGEVVSADVKVSSRVDKDTLVLVALMDEDDGPDFVDERLANLKQLMADSYEPIWATSDLSALTGALKPALIDGIGGEDGYRYNDDKLAVERLKITKLSGGLPVLDMKGGGAHYTVHFRMT